MALPSSPEFRFRGDRNYLSGTTVFDWFLSQDPQATNIDCVFHKMTGFQCAVKSGTPKNGPKLVAVYQSDGLTAHLEETTLPIVDRYDCNEAQICERLRLRGDIAAFEFPLIDTATLRTQSLEYDTIRAQTMGFDSTFGIKRWFAPRLHYTVTNHETYGIPLALDPSAAAFKSVDRTNTGEFDWDVAWRDFSRKVRSLQSLTVSSSYLIEDGDSWNKVAAGYDTLNILSVRKSLSPGTTEATFPLYTLPNSGAGEERST